MVFRLVPATQKGSGWNSCRWEGNMIRTTKIRLGILALGIVLGSSLSALAQQLADRPRQAAARGLAYDATREAVIEGTVLSYSAESATPPIGAHLLLQTANGPVDVHLGGEIG